MRRIVLSIALLSAIATSPQEEPATEAVVPAATEEEPAPVVDDAQGQGEPDEAHHCGGEHVYFSCPVADGKTLSVCGGEGWTQYLFGPLGAPELTFPETREGSNALFTTEERAHARSMGNVLLFDNADFHYEVADMIGGGGGPDAEMNNFRGVMVFDSDEELISNVPCTGEAVADWPGLTSR
jgi:hypothetical protein